MVLTARVLHESEASFSFMLQHLLMLQFCRIPISPSPSLQSLADWSGSRSGICIEVWSEIRLLYWWWIL